MMASQGFIMNGIDFYDVRSIFFLFFPGVTQRNEDVG